MKNVSVFVLGACILLFIAAGCGKDCGGEACPPERPPVFTFRVQNNANADLLAGPARIYDTAQLRIRARRTTNGAVEDMQRQFLVIRNSAGTADSAITTGFTVSSTFNTYYLVLNNVVTDSMFFAVNRRQSQCCDFTTYFLDKVNTNDIPNLELPLLYVIRK